MNNYPEVVLHEGREESALFGHPWIFSKAIKKAPLSCSIINIISHKGDFVGVGSYNPAQTIAIRLFDKKKVTLDEEWFFKRLKSLIAYREILLPNATTYRLCFGESDGIPGLVIDRYGESVSLQINTQGINLLIEPIRKALKHLSFTEIFEKTSDQENLKALPQKEALLWCKEKDLYIALRPGSQKTGWFCDQRENREILAGLNAKTVLNLFSFSGGFSLACLKTGSQLIVNVDRDIESLKLFDLMKKKNNLEGIHENHTEDCWDFLKKELRLFDLVICDPPAFVKQREKKTAALKGYKDIFISSIKRVQPAGFLAVFSCSYYMSLDDLEFALRQAYQITGRFFQTVEILQQPLDHPVPAYFPEGRYLKGFLLKELL